MLCCDTSGGQLHSSRLSSHLTVASVPQIDDVVGIEEWSTDIGAFQMLAGDVLGAAANFGVTPQLVVSE